MIILPTLLLSGVGLAAAAALPAGLPAALPAAQADGSGRDDPVVARFQRRGETAVVTRAELAVELARRLRRQTRGKEALKLLVDRELVAREAEANGLAASPREITERIAEIERALDAQGMRLVTFLEQKNMSRRAFEQQYIALSIAHERLVMKALGLDDRSGVTPHHLELWLKQARRRIGVVTDEVELPAGIVARIGDDTFGLAALGDVLEQNATQDERKKHVRQIVARKLLAAEAAALGIEVTLADAAAEVGYRRAEAESDARYRGVPYEQLLMQAQGISLDELTRAPQTVAAVQQRRIAALRHPDEDLARMLREDREVILRRHGPQRELQLILIRALEQPNELVERDFDAAREEVLKVHQRIEDGLSFAEAARIASEDPYTKVRGGDAGLFFRESQDLPEPLLEAAFTIPLGKVSEPIRTEHGYCLVKAVRSTETPTDEVLAERLRERLSREMLTEMVEQADIELQDG